MDVPNIAAPVDGQLLTRGYVRSYTRIIKSPAPIPKGVVCRIFVFVLRWKKIMPNTERIHIYVDGGNFHHLALKKLHIQEQDFNLEEFAQFLANGRTITGKRFYVGTVREREGDPRSKEAMARQTKFFTVLKSCQWDIKTSKLRMRTEKIVIDERVKEYQELRKKGVSQIEFERTREKGIDVKLATDLIVGAVDNQYDTAILVSSDADLVPAIDWIRFRQRKKVEYVGFSLFDKTGQHEPTKPLQTMITKTDIQRIFAESDVRPFCKPFVRQAPWLVGMSE